MRSGRIGKVQRLQVVLGRNDRGGPFAAATPPERFNWDLWQGQTPDVPYLKERTHCSFRWWSEYSGGQLTDWGAHHLDIAQWMLGQQHSGPMKISGKASYPQVVDRFNVPIDFSVTYASADGVTVEVLDTDRNGVLITGDQGRLFVNRGEVAGPPVEALEEHPLPREQFQLYDFDNTDRPERAGKLDAIINHMGNFVDCLRERRQPIADVASQHRTATTRHLGNIALRPGRTLQWDPQHEYFVADEEANRLLCRPRRAGFELHG